MSDTLALSAEIMGSTNRLAAKHHRRWQRDVQRALDAGTAVERAPSVPHPNWEMGMTASASLLTRSKHL
jgi:hypothetical protein